MQKTKPYRKKIYINGASAFRPAAAALFFAAGTLLLTAAGSMPGFADWYTASVYAVIVPVVGRICGAVPFSVSELLLYVLLVRLLWSLAGVIINVVRGLKEGTKASRREAFKALLKWVYSVAFAAGILFFLYAACCGVNYHSKSFSEREGITVRRYSTEDLKAVCEWLTDNVNNLEALVPRDERGTMVPEKGAGDAACRAMAELAYGYPSLKGYYPKPKELIISGLLSYQGLTGVYSPFTIEANYNGDMTGYNIPFTMCHELSHLRGMMEEKEANFIAFLACTRSGDEDFNYSGYLSAWVYCTNALYKADKDAWEDIHNRLSQAAYDDILDNNAFWEAHDGTVAETSEKVNDTYLKASGQAEGVQGYDRMVDLVVEYYRSGKAE